LSYYNCDNGDALPKYSLRVPY